MAIPEWKKMGTSKDNDNFFTLALYQLNNKFATYINLVAQNNMDSLAI